MSRCEEEKSTYPAGAINYAGTDKIGIGPETAMQASAGSLRQAQREETIRTAFTGTILWAAEQAQNGVPVRRVGWRTTYGRDTRRYLFCTQPIGYHEQVLMLFDRHSSIQTYAPTIFDILARDWEVATV